MTNQLVTPWLAKQFPAAPPLAYWELAFREEVDGADVIKDAQGLKGAGFSMDPADLEEKTGYKVQPDASAPPEDHNVLAGALRGHAVASEEDSGVSTLRNSERPVKRENKPSMAAKLAKVFRMLGFSAEVQRESEWADLLAEAVAEGMESGGEEIRNTNCGIGKNGFQSGNQCGKGRSREPKSKPRGRDLFGPKAHPKMTPDEAEERLGNVIEKSLRDKKGHPGAAYREGLGRIDLKWGSPGIKTKNDLGGYGISHILQGHGEKAVRTLPRVLARGEIKIDPNYPAKRILTHEGDLAILAKEKEGSAWVITAFRPKQK